MYENMNDMQVRAICQTEGPVLILAGAGSGKTRVLTHRAAYLIEEKGVNPYHIMAITFAGISRTNLETLLYWSCPRTIRCLALVTVRFFIALVIPT